MSELTAGSVFSVLVLSHGPELLHLTPCLNLRNQICSRYNAVVPATNSNPGFSKYLISGSVVDESGQGVWGIAVQIGNETVISDSAGAFFIHVRNSKPPPLLVLPDSSLQTSRWSLASAPAAAEGFLDGTQGNPVRVVVQMGQLVASR